MPGPRFRHQQLLLQKQYSPYRPLGAIFDGTNDDMRRGATLTGAADNRYGAISVWVKFNGGDGVLQRMLSNGGQSIEFRKTAANILQIQQLQGASSVSFVTTATYLAGATWYHIGATWDTTAAAGSKICRLVINGVTAPGTKTDASATFTGDNTDTNWSIGGTTSGGSRCNMTFADFRYWQPSALIDFASPQILGQVYSGGKAVAPRSDGSIIIGTTIHTPIVFQRIAAGGAGADFATNRGSGGNFSITGALTTEAGPNG